METLHSKKIKILGITCGACAKLISKRISNIESIKEVNIEEATGETEIVSTECLNIEEIQKTLDGTDYKIANI